MFTVTNQSRVNVGTDDGYDVSVEKNDSGQWMFIWVSRFGGHEMGRDLEGPFTSKRDAEAARDAFAIREQSKGNLVHFM